MIKRLKTKFILLSMVSCLMLLTLVVLAMNLVNYISFLKESDEILELLSHNRGRFPNPENSEDRVGKLPLNLSPELPYETRYFSVLILQTGEISQTDTSRISAVDVSTAIEYANRAAGETGDRGFVEDYRYVRFQEEGGTRITFLDCGRKMDSLRLFLISSAGMAALGFLLVTLVIVILSGKFIRPVAESYEKQKRFITDAGHEIKTPLTIINANADLLEMECGQHECLDEIRHQTRRLTDLTHHLVYLARMEEAGSTLPMLKIPVSDVVEESAAPFRALAQTQNKEFVCQVNPLLSMQGNEEAIGQLVSILLDNALKYSPGEGEIRLSLETRSKSLVLSVYNTTAAEISEENIPLLFERFYRADVSRNSGTGGHGIGLSIAKAIVQAHGGEIRAVTRDGHSLEITATFPV